MRIGDTYTIYVDRIALYYDADHAENKWDPNWHNWKGEKFTIVGLETRGGKQLVGVAHYIYGYDMGWFRHEDNAGKTTITNIPSSFTLNDGATSFIIQFDKQMTNATTRLEIKDGSTQLINKDIPGSSSYTVELDSGLRDRLFNSMPTTTTKDLMVHIGTYQGGKHIGSDSRKITLNINANVKPRFYTALGNGRGVWFLEKNKIGDDMYVNHSSLNVYEYLPSGWTLAQLREWQAPKGATITSSVHKIPPANKQKKIRHNSYNFSVWFPTDFQGAGTYYAAVTLTDSRGRTTTAQTKDVNFITYRTMGIEAFVAQRDQENNSNIVVGAHGSYDNVLPNNEVEFSIRTRAIGATGWNVIRTGLATVLGNRFSINETIVGYDIDKSYEVRIIIADLISPNYDEVRRVGTGLKPIVAGDHGIAVGAYFDVDNPANLQVGSGGISSEGRVRVNGVIQEFHKRFIGDFNPSTVTTSGAARIGPGHASLPPGSAWSQMLTIYGGADTISQMIFPFINTGNPWVRSGNPPEVGGTGSYGPWRQLAFTSDIPNDQPWTPLSVQGGLQKDFIHSAAFSVKNGVGYLQLRNVYFDRVHSGSTIQVSQLPAAYAPTRDIYISLDQAHWIASSVRMVLIVRTNGNIDLITNTHANAMMMSVAVPLI